MCFALCPFYARANENIIILGEVKRMIRKLILLVFVLLSTIGLTGWRIHLLSKAVDEFNGFFKPEYAAQGIAFVVVLAVVLIVSAIFAFTDKKFPGSPRRTSRTLAITNLAYTMVVLLYCFDLMSKVEDAFGVVLLIGSIGLGSFMIYYSMCLFNFKKVMPILSVLPLLFFVINLAYSFINSFGIIKSSVVVFEIVALVFCVVFFLCYARYVSKVNFFKIRKITLVAGICAFVTTAIYSFSSLLSTNPYVHIETRDELSNSLFMVSTSLYILLFLIFSFSNKRLYSAYYKKQKVEYVSESIDESVFGE